MVPPGHFRLPVEETKDALRHLFVGVISNSLNGVTKPVWTNDFQSLGVSTRPKVKILAVAEFEDEALICYMHEPQIFGEAVALTPQSNSRPRRRSYLKLVMPPESVTNVAFLFPKKLPPCLSLKTSDGGGFEWTVKNGFFEFSKANETAKKAIYTPLLGMSGASLPEHFEWKSNGWQQTTSTNVP